MLDLISIGSQIAKRRKTLKLSQAELARKAASAAPRSMRLKTDAPANWAFQSSPNCLPRSGLS